jgi:hypothetical protein
MEWDWQNDIYFFKKRIRDESAVVKPHIVSQPLLPFVFDLLHD